MDETQRHYDECIKKIIKVIQSQNDDDEEEGLTTGKITTKSLEELIKKLDRKITRLPTNEFICELSRLKTIESLWTRNETVPTEVLQLATSGIEDSFANLSLEKGRVNISSIILPLESKQVGRQKRIDTRCTPIRIKRKRINNK
ncbi:hypothetical protein HCN44_008742 [Aphidius gifuensis]|uniref:Uncharacterized protein n=1 Tax=Aphidius gifuensis TaxID=684658 RepID=A0A835CU31_APHGI|nr:hypothetical protein HCN44_008742 [Aphidius gifuensis]